MKTYRIEAKIDWFNFMSNDKYVYYFVQEEKRFLFWKYWVDIYRHNTLKLAEQMKKELESTNTI